MTKPKSKVVKAPAKKENIVSFTTISKVTEPVTTNKSSKLVVPDKSRSMQKALAVKKPFKSTEIKPVEKAKETVSIAELFMKPTYEKKAIDIIKTDKKPVIKVEPQTETISFKDLMNKPPILNRF